MTLVLIISDSDSNFSGGVFNWAPHLISIPIFQIHWRKSRVGSLKMLIVIWFGSKTKLMSALWNNDGSLAGEVCDIFPTLTVSCPHTSEERTQINAATSNPSKYCDISCLKYLWFPSRPESSSSFAIEEIYSVIKSYLSFNVIGPH